MEEKGGDDVKELNQVIDYIEEHLTENLTLEKFRNMLFRLSLQKNIFIYQVTLSEYIKTENYRKQIRIYYTVRK